MIKRVILTFLCTFLFSCITPAQHVLSFRAKATFDSFSADGLKILQKQMLDELRDNFIRASVVESFPPYYGVQFQLLIPVKDSAGVNLGAYFEEFSTKGRIHYIDFSNEIGVDQILSARTTGLIFEKAIDLKSSFSLNLSFGVSLIWAKLHTNIMQRILEKESEISLEFTNFTVGFLPGAALAYNFYDFAILGSVSYQLCMLSGFYYQSSIIKRPYSNEIIKPGMDGIRLGLGMGYSF